MSEENTGSSGGWFSGWIQSAKEMSASTIGLVKRDLAEFTSTMHDDTVMAATALREKLTQENATAATQKVKEGVTTLLGGISKVLVVEPEDDYQLARIVGGEAVIFDRFKARLHALQIDPTTYTAVPVPEDRYNEWLTSFDLESSKGAISELLVSNVEVRALYTQLVPLTVSNNDFWRRYYFRAYVLDEEEARRVQLMKRAENVQGNNEKEIGWDEDDDDTEASFVGKSQSAAVTSESSASRLAGGEESHPESIANECNKDDSISHDSTVSLPSTNISVDASSDSVASSGSAANHQPVELVEDSTAIMNADPVNSSKVTDHESCVSSEQSDWSSLSVNDIVKAESGVVITATPDRATPSEEGSSNAKESLDEDWEKDFDVEVTEQELEAAKERLKNVDATQPAKTDEKVGEDWEDW